VFNFVGAFVECSDKDLPPPISPKDGRDTISLLEAIKKFLLVANQLKYYEKTVESLFFRCI
jgi:hypothetical protein